MTKGEPQYPQWGVQLVSLVKYSRMLRVESPLFKIKDIKRRIWRM
jgi:hypothetical protein